MDAWVYRQDFLVGSAELAGHGGRSHARTHGPEQAGSDGDGVSVACRFLLTRHEGWLPARLRSERRQGSPGRSEGRERRRAAAETERWAPGLGLFSSGWGWLLGFFFWQGKANNWQRSHEPPPPQSIREPPPPPRAQRRTRSTHPFGRIILFHHSSVRCAGGRLGRGGGGIRAGLPAAASRGEAWLGNTRGPSACSLLLPPLRLTAALQLQAAQPASVTHPQPASPPPAAAAAATTITELSWARTGLAWAPELHL